MLCQFTVKNFKSIRDEVTFDMQAAAISEHEDRIIIDKDEEKYLKEIQKIASLKDSQVVRIRTSLEQIFSGYEYLNSIIS